MSLFDQIESIKSEKFFIENACKNEVTKETRSQGNVKPEYRNQNHGYLLQEMPVTEVSEKKSQAGPSRWENLILSTSTDINISNLDDALFLFAYRKIEQSPPEDLPGIWDKFSKYWKQRIPTDVFKVVEQLYLNRSAKNQPLKAGELG